MDLQRFLFFNLLLSASIHLPVHTFLDKLPHDMLCEVFQYLAYKKTKSIINNHACLSLLCKTFKNKLKTTNFLRTALFTMKKRIRFLYSDNRHILVKYILTQKNSEFIQWLLKNRRLFQFYYAQLDNAQHAQEIAEYFVTYYPPNKLTEFTAPIFAKAIDHEWWNILQFLIAHKCDVNYEFKYYDNEWFRLPLHRAIKKGNLKLVHYLIDHGADIKQKTRWGGFHAIHVATCNLPILKYLHQLWPEGIHTRTPFLESPFYFATQFNNAQTITWLAQQKVNIHTCELNETKMLQHAITKDESHKTLKALLDAGIHVNAARGFNKSNALQTGCCVNRPTAKNMRLLIAHGINIHHQNEKGDTPLHWNHADWEGTRVLMESGANPLIKNKKGETPLDKARNQLKKYQNCKGWHYLIPEQKEFIKMLEAYTQEYTKKMKIVQPKDSN